MNNFKLNNCGVEAMSAKEMQDVNGGFTFIVEAWALGALLALSIAGVFWSGSKL